VTTKEGDDERERRRKRETTKERDDERERRRKRETTKERRRKRRHRKRRHRKRRHRKRQDEVQELPRSAVSCDAGDVTPPSLLVANKRRETTRGDRCKKER
jgi:hypothetical protein